MEPIRWGESRPRHYRTADEEFCATEKERIMYQEWMYNNKHFWNIDVTTEEYKAYERWLMRAK